MGLKKILKQLTNLLEEGKSPDGERCDAIQELLKKLEKKQSKLEKEIGKENKASKRKSLKLDLKITKAQLKKGRKLLGKSCD